MSRRLHIINRNGVFYWRRRLPARLATVSGRSHWTMSLSTRDRKTAQQIGRRLSYEFDRFLTEMTLQNRTPTKSEQENLFRALYRSIREECEAEHLRKYALEEIPKSAVHHYLEEELSPDPVPPEVRDRHAFYRFPEISAQKMQEYARENRFTPIRTLLSPHLANLGIDSSTDDLDFRRFLSISIAIAARAFDDAARGVSDIATQSIVDRVANTAQAQDSVGQAQVVTTAEVVQKSEAAPAAKPPASEPNELEPLSVFVQQYVDRKRKRIATSTLNKKHNSLKILLKFVGDVPPPGIDRDIAEQLHDLLERLPSSYGKSEYDKDRPLEEVLRDAPGTETMSRRTLNKHWMHIKEFYGDLNRRPVMRGKKIDLEEVFGQLSWDRSVRDPERSVPWTDDDIGCLFRSPIWTGFKPDPEKRYWRHEPGPVVIRDEFWWLPLLGLYQGMRLEEICQLKGTNVRIEPKSGVLVIDLHKGMRLKNKASIRMVPVHSALLKLGFDEIAKEAGERPLFPKMEPDGVDQKLGHQYSERFTDYRKRINVYAKGMNFHAFRANFTTRLLDDGGRTVLEADELTGHDSAMRKDIKEMKESESIAYFHGHKHTKLKEAIETVVYPMIDLDTLLAASANSEGYERKLEKRFAGTWCKSSWDKRE